jgi:hypothetical protein
MTDPTDSVVDAFEQRRRIMIEAKALVAAAALVVPIVAAPALHAQDSAPSQTPHGSMMSPGMMGGNMMNMMGSGSERQDMVDHCSQMMSGGPTRPNEQWRNNSPVAPDEQD